MDGIIPAPLGFMMSGIVIQTVYDFRLIMNIGSWQAPILILGLTVALLEEEALKAET